MEDNYIVEEKKDNLSKEEIKNDVLNFASNKKLMKKAIYLYKNELFEKQIIEKIDESLYQEINLTDYHGYSLYVDNNNSLYFIKSLTEDDSEKAVSFELLKLIDLTDEEYQKILESNQTKTPLQWIIIISFIVWLTLGFVAFFYVFFSMVSSDFMSALSQAFLFSGGYILIGLGLLYLMLYKCGKKK